jgi:hypothetical protein
MAKKVKKSEPVVEMKPPSKLIPNLHPSRGGKPPTKGKETQEWDTRFAAGMEADERWYQAWRAKKDGTPAPAKLPLTKTATGVGPVRTEANVIAQTPTLKPQPKGRKEWMGLGMCELIRALGKIPKEQVFNVMAACGFTPSQATINIQYGYAHGKKGCEQYPVPTLTPEQKKALDKIIKAVKGK